MNISSGLKKCFLWLPQVKKFAASDGLRQEQNNVTKKKLRLIKWIGLTSILVSISLTHIFAVSFLAYEPDLISACHDNGTTDSYTILTKGLHDSFDNDEHNHDHECLELDNEHEHEHEHENEQEQEHQHYNADEPFCCMMWLKVVFFSGFAFGQFSLGFAADKYGRWNILKLNVRVLILAGMIASSAGMFI
jgi:hypothetical protein